MIKFFRKIRQELLMENKIGKYFKYAIGEIILVVIGILIALQINNYNNYKEQRKTEQELLISLQTEFKSNLEKLNVSIDDNKVRKNALEDLLTLFDISVLDSVSNKSISFMLDPIFGSDLSYKPSLGVVSDMISSGKLNIILNKNLRQKLASFESSLDYLKIQEEEANNIKQSLKSLLFKELSIRNIQKDIGRQFENQSISDSINNKRIFNSVELENHLLDYSLVTNAANDSRFFGGLKEEIEYILKEIENELNK
ncbi:hypothetical protein JYB62_13575 [Algoriphagus lutimaris]|uniref:DUF6090 family protein n=1 Tax=Algoriphagus lutimaris TaxID=613197 RepID=UPI00196A4B1C|nr:DUF6090 family protein [Algoriphagus lutimaris]MBN3521034.1 hypothetical protein [Algoriphagus lutimaris]